MSKLRDKAAAIDLTSDDDAPPPLPPVIPAKAPDGPRTAIGAISASLAMGRGLQDENTALKSRVRDLEDATIVEFIDPKRIRASRWANRHPASFTNESFEGLRQEIATAGRNVQAIKVRRAGKGEDGKDQYEIIFGHRRHRACLELGIPVAAVIEDMSDVQLFAEMDRENRSRADLSPYEQGVMYRRALDEGLFPSLRRLADAIGVQPGNVSTAMALAALPASVIQAFEAPTQLQYRWAAPLASAHQRDAAAVDRVAAELAAIEPRLAAREVYDRLVAAPEGQSEAADTKSTEPLRFEVQGRAVAQWARDSRGGGSLKLVPGALTPAKERRLVEFLQKLLAG